MNSSTSGKVRQRKSWLLKFCLQIMLKNGGGFQLRTFRVPQLLDLTSYSGQKAISVLVALGVCSVLYPFAGVLIWGIPFIAFIRLILDPGHFGLATYYQFRSGRWNGPFILTVLVATSLLFLLIFWNFRVYLFLAYFWFGYHVLSDEVELAKKFHLPTSMTKIGLLTPLILAIFSCFLYQGLFRQSLPTFVTQMLSAAGFLIGFFALAWRPEARITPVVLSSGLLILFSVLLYWIPKVRFEFIVTPFFIFHYCSWYLHYFYKPKVGQQTTRTFLIDLFWVNLFWIPVNLGLWFLMASQGDAGGRSRLVISGLFIYHLVASTRWPWLGSRV